MYDHNHTDRPKYKEEAREQRAKVARRDDRISALEQENEQLRDQVKRLEIQIASLKYDLKEDYLKQEEL